MSHIFRVEAWSALMIYSDVNNLEQLCSWSDKLDNYYYRFQAFHCDLIYERHLAINHWTFAEKKVTNFLLTAMDFIWRRVSTLRNFRQLIITTVTHKKVIKRVGKWLKVYCMLLLHVSSLLEFFSFIFRYPIWNIFHRSISIQGFMIIGASKWCFCSTIVCKALRISEIMCMKQITVESDKSQSCITFAFENCIKRKTIIAQLNSAASHTMPIKNDLSH